MLAHLKISIYPPNYPPVLKQIIIAIKNCYNEASGSSAHTIVLPHTVPHSTTHSTIFNYLIAQCLGARVTHILAKDQKSPVAQQAIQWLNHVLFGSMNADQSMNNPRWSFPRIMENICLTPLTSFTLPHITRNRRVITLKSAHDKLTVSKIWLKWTSEFLI